MRKTTAFLLLLISFSCKQPKPEGFALNVQFQPEKTYRISTIRGTETVITYSGEGFAMKKLKSMKVQNPTISTVKTKTDTELETGIATADSTCSLKLTYIKTMSLDGKNNIPEGTVVTGEVNANHQPVFQSVQSPELGIDQRISLIQNLQKSFDQFQFPVQRLKVGDTLSVKRPVIMAMEGSEIDMVVESNYKLMSLEKGLANFEFTQNYTMTPRRMDNSFTGTGTGKGQMTYDAGKMLISDYSLKTELTMNKKLDYFEFDLKTTSEFSQSINLK